MVRLSGLTNCWRTFCAHCVLDFQNNLLIGPDSVCETIEKVVMIRDRILAAQSRQ